MGSIVDKSSIGIGGRQFHVGVAPGEVSTVALMPGDPFRVPLVAEYLDDPVEVAHKREHRTMVGTYKGRTITVTSTGMGCPSTAIAVEELARVGVTTFIRVGSTGALQEGMEPGDLVISQGSFRNDGTTDAYVPKGYPAVPDLAITLELERIARERAPAHSLNVHVGLNVTDDAFYAESPEWTMEMSRLGLLNVEMESSAMFVVARQRGLRAAMICAVSSNLVTGTSVYAETAHERLAVGWRASIETALEAAARLEL
ncbi:MAG TPA: nucleoside phosphorylase [Candidatus Saccharimonadales bacterium]|nr:nucleoside phosphorylase [Candidatus Saccharimonadales bacterium]